MVNEMEVRDTTNRAGAAKALESAFVVDPLRGSRSAKRWTRIGVYLAILGYGPLYLFVFGYELRQVFTSWTVGLIIATIAIELAFWQMFKLRKRGAYPGVLLAELGSGHHLNSAAQHCLGVIQRLMGTRAAFLALCNGDDDFDLMSVSGMGREAAERLLRAGVRELEEAMRSQQPVPFKPADASLSESGVSRKDRLVFIPVAALRQPIGVLVVVGHRRNPDLKDGQLLSSVGVALGLSLESLRQGEEIRKSEERLHTVIASTPIVMFALDCEGTFMLAEGSGLDTLGFHPSHVLGRSVFDACRDMPQVLENVRRALAGEAFTTTLEVNGRVLEAWLSPVSDHNDELNGITGVVTDVTERKRAEDALRESETKFRTLTETVAAAAFIVQDTRFRYVNSTTEELTGYSREELLAMDFWDVIHPDSQELVKQRGMARQRGEDVPRQYETKLLTKSGEERWADLTLGVIEFEGKPAVLGTGFDITERKRAEDALRQSEERYRLLADNVTDMIWTRDLSLRPTYTSPSVTRLRGHTVEEAMAQTLDEVLTPDSLAVARKALAEELAKESAEDKDLTRTRTLELEMYRKDGSTIWTEMTVNFLRDEENRPTGIMGVTRDISERKKADEERERLHAELEVRAITDSLTGLYDHAHFYQRLAEDIERSRRYNHGFALMMMDVDDFKRFNDSRGHQAGDEALRLVADCIRSGLRRSDLAFRYGGDEFAAILPRADSAMARAVVDRINGRIARRLKKTDDQAAAQLTLSAGIACFPDDGTAADDLVRIADDALYNAKWVARARDIMRQSEDIQSLVSALVSRRAGAEVPTGQAPLRPEALHEQHARIVSSVASSIAVALKDAGVAQALEDPDMQILATVGAAAEIKDRYIRGHPERVSEGAMALAEEIGLPPERVRDIRIAGLLHDIGKITVSEGILNKPGKLTRREFATIKEHPIVGATLVSQVKGFEQLIPIIRHHHERFDGAGYPGGLAGEEIPVEARILSVVDVFDALTHERSYRNALSREEAIGELERGAGTQFDPAVLKAFLALVERRGEKPATPAQAAREDRQLAAAAAKGQKLKATGER